ncbi:hypothetical protein SAMN05660657_03725 [Geodermatophilus amargosae]|uniref:Uncharacterized protein n=1 Tax=Geodermatophilus amargosae TaxID=1296565 RepID=A0A1I7BP61_9ACTN|nr:hypothetical protein SAMN05660657_03725 [Geodermatophilus amargosae]
MTASPWAGWEDVLTGLLLLVLFLAVGVAVVLWSAAVRASSSGRAEWQAELDARSAGRRHPGTGAESDHVGDVERGRFPGGVPSGACRRRTSHQASA